MLPPTLLQSIRNGQCVPFVGAGLSKAVADLPVWTALMDRMMARLRIESPEAGREASNELDAGNLLDCAEILRSKLHDFPSALRAELTSAHPPKAAFLDAVLQISPSLIVTTNYDSLLRNRGISVVVDNENTDLLARVNHGEPRAAPWLWHLHGLLERPSTLIFGRGDYERLYVQKSDLGERVQRALQTLIYQKHVLFIGYGFGDDPVMAEFLRWKELFARTFINAFAIVKTPGNPSDSERYQGLEKDFGLGLIYVKDWGADFLETLQMLASARGMLPDRRGALPAAQPGLIARSDHIRRISAVLGLESESVIALVGPGGSGKTQLALKFAEQETNSRFRFFMQCETQTTLDESLRKLATALLPGTATELLSQTPSPSSNQPLITQLRDHLAVLPSGYTLIWDALDPSRKDLLFSVCPIPSTRGSVLITSRDQRWTEFCRVENITHFNDEELRLIQDRFKIPADRMAEIRAAYGGHPLSTFFACLRSTRGRFANPSPTTPESDPVGRLIGSILEDLPHAYARRALFVLALIHPAPACATLLGNCIVTAEDDDVPEIALSKAQSELFQLCLVNESPDGELMIHSWLAESLLAHAPEEEIRSTLLLIPDRLNQISNLSGKELRSYALSVASFSQRYPFDKIAQLVEVFKGEVNKLLWVQIYIPFLEKASTTLSNLRLVDEELAVRANLAKSFQYLFSQGVTTVGTREFTERITSAVKLASRQDRRAMEELKGASEILEQMYGVTDWTQIRNLPDPPPSAEPGTSQQVHSKKLLEWFLQFRAMTYAHLCGGGTGCVQPQEARLAFEEFWAVFNPPPSQSDGGLLLTLVEALLAGGLTDEAQKVLDHPIMLGWATSAERKGFRVKHRRASLFFRAGRYQECVAAEIDTLKDCCAQEQNLVDSDLVGILGVLEQNRNYVTEENRVQIDRTANAYLLRIGVLRSEVDAKVRERLGEPR